VDCLGGVRGIGCGGEGYVAFVDGDVLLRRTRDSHLVVMSVTVHFPLSELLAWKYRDRAIQTYLPTLPFPLIHNPLLHNPQPITKRAIQQEVRNHRGQSIGFAGFPAKFPVVGEERASDGDGGVAEDEPYVGLRMNLAEFEGVEVVWESVVGCVFEVCEVVSMW
jgi:hypothetical protein